MTVNFRILSFLLIVTMLVVACGERRSEEAQGRELELAGDEPDEEQGVYEEVKDYDPADTVLTLDPEALTPFLRDQSLVVVNAYLDIEEALLNENPEAAKDYAQELLNVLKRHEQENMDLQPEVKEMYTKATNVFRTGARNVLFANEMWEVRSAFSAMGPSAYKLAKIADFSDLSLYYQYCPEAFDNRGAYWLSRTEEIKNPFSSEEMKNCGRTIARL